MASALDIMASYKTMPHVDMEETKTKGLMMLLHALQYPSCRPTVVVVPIPASLPAGDVVLHTEGYGRELFRWLRDPEQSI